MLDVQLSLPPLREDLSLHRGATQKDGSPSWVIEDPLKGRFYRIGWLELEVLKQWHLADANQVARAVAAHTPLRPEVNEVLAIRAFLLQHELLVNRELLQKATQGPLPQPGLATQALHNYLMFRIPLVNPDRFLERWLPMARPLLGARAFVVSMIVALVGLGLAAQQWDTFAATFVETLSLPGLISYAAALVFAKVLHELGHAFTAKNLGLRVPRMGVALVLLLPMLYTDTGQTWRLTRKQDRFAIAVAGMRIELMVAAWCTLAWTFLPDGAARAAMFFLATTSWLITLAINASPFLRFDGYYMLSDATGIVNLHDEAAAALRRRLRRSLLGMPEPEQTIEGEPAPGWLMWFGLSTAVYRFFLFVGIAVAVYHFFFKALGIFLFAVEIWWFILRPIFSEMKVWWKRRQDIAPRPLLRSSLALVLLGVLIAVPWQGQIQAQGWVRAESEFAVFSPRTAQVKTLPHAGPTQAQALLATLQSPELQLRQARGNARREALDSKLMAATGAEPLGESVRSTREQLAQQWTEISGAKAESRQLQLLAPFSGRVVDAAYDLAPGVVVARQELLARVVDPSQWVAEAYVDEEDVRRLRVGAKARVYLQGLSTEVMDATVQQIDSAPLTHLPAEMLADRFGGPLLTVEEGQQLKPRQPLYRVRLSLQQNPRTEQVRLAGFSIEGERASVLGRIQRSALGALMLQASF